jgi:hypothetical protein
VTANLHAASDFMTTHARMLDRRRFELLVGDGDASALLAALEPYRNPDGGYGWGLEPDLRAPESQPGGALHAFEAIEEAAPATTARSAELCDWLDTATLPDGGLPFALPVANPAGCAPFWANADPTTSSLQISAYVTSRALRVAAHDPAVSDHPWLARATDYCLRAIEAIDDAPFAIQLLAAIQLLDAAHATRPEAEALLERLGRFIPDDGVVPVAGGSEDEALHPLDFSPAPGSPSRALFREEAVAAELERLADAQQDDGGWVVDFASYSPAGALEWRGYRTVWAVQVLRDNEVL